MPDGVIRGWAISLTTMGVARSIKMGGMAEMVNFTKRLAKKRTDKKNETNEIASAFSVVKLDWESPSKVLEKKKIYRFVHNQCIILREVPPVNISDELGGVQ